MIDRASSCGVLLALGMAMALSPLPAQSLPQARMSVATKTAIDRLVDSLTVERLPGDAIRDKVAEGVLKGADDTRILAAVRSLASRLREGRQLLGGTASDDELKAAASALFAGIEPSAIARLVETQRRRGAATLTMPLTIVAELALRNVPIDLAVSSVESLLRRGARDGELNAFRNTIERDLQQGRAPRDAVSAGMRITLNNLGRTPE
jgi:hypothetical protein